MVNKKHIHLYMKMADTVAEMSVAIRLKVGTVVVKNNNVIGFGWNGTPSGWSNECEDRVWDKGAGGWLSPEEIYEQYPYEGWHETAGRTVRYGLKTKPIVLHSEANAVLKIARSTESSEGATLFCTHAPCLDCAKLIYQSGISSVYYRNTYRETAGVDFLTSGGVVVEQYSSK